MASRTEILIKTLSSSSAATLLTRTSNWPDKLFFNSSLETENSIKA